MSTKWRRCVWGKVFPNCVTVGLSEKLDILLAWQSRVWGYMDQFQRRWLSATQVMHGKCIWGLILILTRTLILPVKHYSPSPATWVQWTFLFVPLSPSSILHITWPLKQFDSNKKVSCCLIFRIILTLECCRLPLSIHFLWYPVWFWFISVVLWNTCWSSPSPYSPLIFEGPDHMVTSAIAS